MIAILFATFLLLLALLALTLEKAYFYVPDKELKRQAARRDYTANILYQAAVYDGDLKLLLFTIMGASAAGSFVLLARNMPPLLGFVVVGIALLFVYAWLPRTRLTRIEAQLAIWCTPAVVRILRFLHPGVQHISGFVIPRRHGHTGMYEHEDMYELLDRQKMQGDNRMSEQELELMRNVLHFGEYRVGDIVVPRKQVKSVSANDDISPVLLAELHATGHPRFPVYEGKASNIIGTLAIDMIADVRQHGKVRDNFDRHVAYLHEEDNLEQALRAFYETRQHLFIVVNKLNEYVGIITLSDILHQLFGAIEHEAFGRHDDREAVVHRHDRKEPEPKVEKDEEKVSENPPEVVE